MPKILNEIWYYLKLTDNELNCTIFVHRCWFFTFKYRLHLMKIIQNCGVIIFPIIYYSYAELTTIEEKDTKLKFRGRIHNTSFPSELMNGPISLNVTLH